MTALTRIALDLRYAACAVARGYRVTTAYVSISSPTARTLDTVLTEWRRHPAHGGSGRPDAADAMNRTTPEVELARNSADEVWRLRGVS
jgi:hypothetical protein